MTDKQASLQFIYHLPDGLNEDLQAMKSNVARFKAGEMTAGDFRAFRVPQGIYQQRRCGTFMLRVRLAAAAILPHQMRAVAEVSRQYGSGRSHATTRGELQIHDVEVDGMYPALCALRQVGLSTKGGGGDTVRNIPACFDAGVCAREAFDVTPYAVAMTEFLLSDPTSFELPRKYKVAFSGCGKDCASATVSDAGFIAKRRNRTDGFAVYVGGGLGARSRVADMLEDFVPADQAHLVAEAIKRVFAQHGERKNRRQARLRFLIERIGIDHFGDLYEKELAALKNQSVQCPALRQIVPARAGEPKRPDTSGPGEAFDLWREKYVIRQRQSGYYLVKIPLPLGDLESQTMLGLADVVESYGEGMLRLTIRQSAVIRWVTEGELGQVYQRLEQISLARPGPALCDNMVSCTGAATCRLGICLSRGLKVAIVEELTKNGPDLDKFPELDINISGCPNACGRHPVGQIGLYGAVRHVKDRPVPYYIVQLGGKLAEGQTRLANGKIAIPARNVPAFLVDFLRTFGKSQQYPDFDGFLAAADRRVIEQLADAYKQVPDFKSDKNYYYDWGAKTLFSLVDRSESECEGIGQGVEESGWADAGQAADRALDCRGVACPLNYVKTLAVLEQMSTGQSLSVLLDQDGASNVPKSVVLDGHEVLATSRSGEHWQVVIRKK